MVAPHMPPSLQGKTAYELISPKALIAEIRQNMPMLSALSDPIPEFDRLLIHQDSDALVIAETFEQRLFWLIHILKFSHPDNLMARPEWDESYWDTFARMKQFIFGGGFMRGALGTCMVAYTQALLGDVCAVKIAPHAPILPLLGASRLLPPDTQEALIFDFGQTSIKRGIATYVDGILTILYVLPPIPALPHTPQPTPRQMADHIIDILANTWHEYATSDTACFFSISIATYLQDNQPFGDNYYGSLTQITVNMGQFLADALKEKIGVAIQIRLIHDGTASALVYAGEADTAVITIGTALGIGFSANSNELLRPIASRLIIN
jgi:hypothetical protein